MALATANEFLIESGYHYFNTGRIGPTAKVALEAVSRTTEKLLPRVSHGYNLFAEFRLKLAKLLGCLSSELALTRNATEANSTIAAGLRLAVGEEVTIDSHAHLGGAIPWMTRAKYDGIVVKAFEPSPIDDQTNLDRIVSLIGPRTRVIQVSHVTAPTGIRLPVIEISKICKEKNIWFHIDGAQSLGMFPFRISELHCDSFAASGHKWLCGPLGTGILKDCRIPDVLDFADTACRFECGTRDPAPAAGLHAAMEKWKAIGTERIAEHGQYLAAEFGNQVLQIRGVKLMSPANSPLSSAMVAFQSDKHTCDELFAILAKAGFRCRPVREQGLNSLRVSFHIFNSKQRCDQLLETIRATLK